MDDVKTRDVTILHHTCPMVMISSTQTYTDHASTETVFIPSHSSQSRESRILLCVPWKIHIGLNSIFPRLFLAEYCLLRPSPFRWHRIRYNESDDP